MARLTTLRRKVAWAGIEGRAHLASLQTDYEDLCKDLFGLTTVELVELLEPGLSLRQTFLRPLPRSKLELFGQYNGALLRSLRREDMHEYVSGEDHWMCVPYDANIGVFVLRKDLLGPSELDGEKLASALARLKVRETKIWEALDRVLDAGTFDGILDGPERFESVVTDVKGQLSRCIDESTNVGTLASRMIDWASSAAAGPIAAAGRIDWDTALCLSIAGGHPLGLETRTFDTFMAFFLELIWNCGGRLNVDAGYRIRKKEDLLVPLVLALHYFTAIFDLTDTPRDQTVDPSLAPSTKASKYGEWLFGRFWYSTLVDSLTARVNGQHGEFVWRSPAAIEIIAMPKGPSAEEPGNFACWGEWSFALLAGSENVELACDLVSNLMGAFKVTDRGLRSAALPTVGQFYKQFGEQRCVAADLRPDLKLPSMTFREFRSQFLEPQRQGKHIAPEEQIFRQYIFDYRHCARVVYASLLSLKDPASPVSSDEQAARAVVSAAFDIIAGIEKLRETYLFVGDTFRHDVIQTQQYRRIERGYPRRRPRAADSVSLRTGAEQFTADIIDISRGGCRLRSPRGAEIPIEAEVEIALDGVGPVAGTCRWSRKTRLEFGLEFMAPLDRATWWSVVGP
jgi:hypothetical protein